MPRLGFETGGNEGSEDLRSHSRNRQKYSLILLVVFCSEKFVRGAPLFGLAQGELGSALPIRVISVIRG
jgi:hypothetical protein